MGAAMLGAGCGERAADVTVVRFWAMGREGEVVTALLPEFERTHPGIRVDVQQLPWTAAHEKLLTAFAGDATPDICQLGNTWIPEFVALGALQPLGASLAPSSVDPHDFFAGIWDTNVVGGQVYGVPWYVDTRLLFYRRDVLGAAGIAAPPASWSEWMRALAAVKAHARARPLRDPAADERSRAAAGPRAFSRTIRCCVTADATATSGAPAFAARLRFTSTCFVKAMRRRSPHRSSATCGASSGAARSRIYISGPWNIGEFERRLPAGSAGHLGHRRRCPDPRGRARRSRAARASCSFARRR